jgi:hypothetical protein
MKRNKKLLVSFLALNAVLSSYTAGAESVSQTGHERMYNSITKNMEQGKPNEKNYQIIERMLKLKNKELKDLYLQGDYVVKPEYLEWQVFFTGFYDEYGEGKDNSKENARYHSKVTGYYDANGNYVTSGNTNGMVGKPYQPLQQPKDINLGVSIPLKGMSKDPLNLSLSPVQSIDVNPNVVTVDITVPTISGDVDLPSFSPISAVAPPDLSRISINWPRTSTTGITATVTGGNTVVNSSNLTYTVNSGSNMNGSGYYIQNGTVINDGTLEIDYDGPGNSGGGVTSNNTFHGIWSQSNNAARFVNNGDFNIYTNLVDNGGDVGSVMGVHFYNHDIDTNQVIENYGTVRVKQAIWMQIEDSEGRYLSHASDGRIGNVIVDEGSQALQVWRCCYVDSRDNDSIAYLDPGIIIVRGGSTGINIVESNAGMRSEVVNDNVTGDSSKDSQLIVESGNGLVFTVGSNLKSGLYEEVNIPIYQMGAGTNGLIVIDGTANGVPGWSTSGRGKGVVHLGTGAKIEIRTPGNMVDRTTGIYTNAAQAIDNEGTVSNITNNSYSVTLNDGTVLNYAAQADGSKNTVGVYITKNNGMALNTEILSGETTADIHYRQNGGSIRIGGENSVALYNDSDIVKIMNNAEVEASNGAVGIYTKGDGTAGSAKTLIKNSNLIAGNKSLLFYNEAGGQIDFEGPTTALIKTGGTAFYSKGTTALTDYLNINNLTVKMEENSTLLMLEEPLTPIFLNALPGVTGVNIDPSSSTNYKKVSQYRGDFFINQNVVLDNDLDDYVQALLISTRTELMPTFSITGGRDNQVGIKTGANTSILLNTDISAVNQGVIQLSGSNTVGLYTNFGSNTNTNTLSISGFRGVGQFAENGSIVLNSGNITIGNEGVGIYAVGAQDLTNIPLFGDKKIDVTNTGTINANLGSKAVGIYADNNKIGGTIADSNINLASGTINVKDSENGVGLYVNKGIVTESGSTITVGKNGVGIYAKDSDLTLNNLTLNLHGDNALGLYLEGNTNLLTGFGNIDVNGQNVILYIINTNAGTTINNNFTVTANSGSTYTLGNITGGTFEYTGTANLASNGTLVTGKQSTIYLNGSTITSALGSTNVAAAAIEGQGTGTIPGMTAGVDGENNGTIVLGDNSVGIYGKNGSRISNRSVITVGNASAGLMTSGASSFAVNSGTITGGTGSQGIYVKDGDYAHNTGTGNILSSGAGAVGIYADNTAVHVTNDGNIDLSGDKSIGIYSTGVSPQNINNNSLVKVGDSASTSDPNIGIYSAVPGSIVTNAGTVTSGISSIGIYSNGGTINNNGTSNVGDAGVGIYSTGGIVNLNASTLNMGTNEAVGVYGVYATVTNSSNLNIGNSNYGFILKGGSFTDNPGMNNTVGSDSVYMYSTEGTAVVNDATLTMTGSDNVGFYMAQDPVSGLGGAVMTNTGTITGTAGNSNIGIYNYGGTVNNQGTINVGNSDLLFVTKEDKTTELDIQNSKYAVGIYGEDATIINGTGAHITAGYGGYGIVAKGGSAVNSGTITTNGDYSTGMYTEGGVITNALGATITINGDNAIGMAGKGAGSQLINNGTINVNGDDSIAMYGNLEAIIINTGKIYITGNSQPFISSDPKDPLHDVVTGTATINGTVDNTIQSIGSVHVLPELINAGIIKTTGVLALDGMQVMIKPDPTTKRPSSDPDYDFELSGTSIIADEITTSKPIIILPGFADGTNANVYKLEGVINATSGQYDFISGSLLWEAIPRATGSGSDVYMSRKAFTDFTDELWFEDFGTALENNYLTATGDGVTIYNKTAYIQTEEEFRQVMGSMAGNVYSNINQREYDMAKALEESLHLLQDSSNNTKENVKISVIAGKGKNKEETDGVTGYDYAMTGILALREVERTYRHTFGYSLGYLHTGFEFKDGNESEEWVDTIQLGIHNKYTLNNWLLRNDITGRASIHNVDRNLNWPSPLEKSKMDGSYETYSITSDNILGKEFEIGKKASIMPYGAFKAMYVTRPKFNEKGLEALEVEGNDAWSAKPRAGVELKGAVPLGNTSSWQLKGTLDFAYEYELADLNEREKARLVAIEDGYHKLSKPQDEKGTFRTRAAIGVEVEDRYGIFLTGEYSTGNDKEDDYRTGVTLKAVF